MQCASSIANSAIRHAREQVQRVRHREPLRGDIEQVELAVAERPFDRAGLARRQGGIERGGAHPGLAQRVDLVLHQRDQRRDDDPDPRPQQRGQLVAQRLAAAGRHQHERVAAGGDVLDDLLLLAAEARIAEDAAQQAERGCCGSGSLTGVGVELCCTACGWLYAAADAGKPYARSGARMHEIAQAFLLVYAGLFPIVNPVGNAPIFLALTASHTERVRHDLARRIAVSGFVLLLASLFVGSHVLQFFGITIPVLRVAGGLVVGVFGWQLLRDGASRRRAAPARSGRTGRTMPSIR